MQPRWLSFDILACHTKALNPLSPQRGYAATGTPVARVRAPTPFTVVQWSNAWLVTMSVRVRLPSVWNSAHNGVNRHLFYRNGEPWTINRDEHESFCDTHHCEADLTFEIWHQAGINWHTKMASGNTRCHFITRYVVLCGLICLLVSLSGKYLQIGHYSP